MDLNGDGILTGSSTFKIAGPLGALVIKNAKGIALDSVTAPYYTPLGAVETKTGYDLALEGVSGSEYEGLYSVWSTNEYGKIISEANWITAEQFVAAEYEEYFNVDVNDDGFTGKSELIDSQILLNQNSPWR